MKIGKLINNGTINEITNSQVLITTQGICVARSDYSQQQPPNHVELPEDNTRKRKNGKPPKKPFIQKPKTIKYYQHGNNRILIEQRKRVDIVFKFFTAWKWIGNETKAADFDSFFEGNPRHCNIIWKGNSTILTIFIRDLLSTNYIVNQKRCSATSIVKEQFGKTPSFDGRRLTNDEKEHIKLTLLILDIKNPLPQKHQHDETNDTCDLQESALKAVFDGQLRSTKSI